MRPLGVVELVFNLRDRALGQQGYPVLWGAWYAGRRFFIDFDVQDVLTKKHQSAECLILDGNRHFAGNRQMGQKMLDFRGFLVLGGAFCHGTDLYQMIFGPVIAPYRRSAQIIEPEFSD